MAPLTNTDRLFAYRDALRNWRFAGYLSFTLTELSLIYVRDVLGLALSDIARRMHEHVEAGGTINEVREQREQWRDLYEFHYDMHIMMEGRRVYLETRLIYRLPVLPDDSSILVVNIHDA